MLSPPSERAVEVDVAMGRNREAIDARLRGGNLERLAGINCLGAREHVVKPGVIAGDQPAAGGGCIIVRVKHTDMRCDIAAADNGKE